MKIENNLPTFVLEEEMQLILFLFNSCAYMLGLGFILLLLTRFIEELYNAYHN